MDHRENALTIGRLAAMVGVNVETIRFYQRKGFLREPLRPPGGVRHYTPADAARVKFIKSAQRLGFSLDEIRHLLRLDEGMQCDAAAQLAAQHLGDVRRRLQDLRRIEATLANLLEQCGQGGGKVTCPLIVALYADEMKKDYGSGP
ncbi:MAG: Hg(II)-responsive transcriptional regulator [Gammaproteobacteria bacterium]|nr:Hg(II)-responsive transcriptional regulator [Gammaproteobacteria bacterium]